MSVENLQKFYRFIDQRSEIRSLLENLPDRSSFIKCMVQLGSENGFMFTPNELESALAGLDSSLKESVLSDEQLNAVAGGAKRSSTGSGAQTTCGEFTKFADPFCV